MDALETTPPSLPLLPEPKLSEQAKELLGFVILFARLFGGNTWKSIAALAKAELNGTLSATALVDLEVLLAKHGLKL